MGRVVRCKFVSIFLLSIFLSSCSSSWDGNAVAEEMYRLYFEGFPGVKRAYDENPSDKDRLINSTAKAYESGGQGYADNAFLSEFWHFYNRQINSKISRVPDAEVIHYALALSNWLDFLSDKYQASCYDIALTGSDLNRLSLVLEHADTQSLISAGDALLAKAGPNSRKRALEREMQRQLGAAEPQIAQLLAPQFYSKKFVAQPLSATTPKEKHKACHTLSATLKYFSSPQRNSANAAAFLRSYLEH